MMSGRQGATFVLACLAALVASACTTPKEVFLHRAHRENYALTPAELESVQFFIEKKVVARAVQGQGANDVLILPAGTGGAAVEVGERYLRVSFQSGGAGVAFVAVQTRGGESAYWLASPVDGEPGYHALKDMRDKDLVVPAGTFDMVSGADARLLISSKDLQRLIKSREHLQGRKPGQP
jgi:hypothetical protein